MSAEGVRALATAVIRSGLRTMLDYEDTEGFEFWCGVVGIEPAVVRSRCAVR